MRPSEALILHRAALRQLLNRYGFRQPRVFGSVPIKYIYGRAVFAYWPVDHFGSLSTTEASTTK